jgi:DnaJ-domain-containing protein 1
MNPTDYPLAWPTGWKRTARPVRAAFKVSMTESLNHLYRQFELMGVSNVVISSNMQTRLDGRPLSKQTNFDDQGVAIYFTRNGQQQCIPCDKWDKVESNIRAIGLTVEALRSLDRWGAKETVDAAFQGFTALPSGAGAISTPDRSAQTWYEILEVSPSAGEEVIKAAYRAKIAKAHPDRGGSEVEFKRIQSAYEEGLQ